MISPNRAISPVDGRYRNQTEELNNYFSEFALIKYRILVEVEYFIALRDIPLSELKSFNSDNFTALRNLYINFSETDANRIKEIEKTTNHDVKAVEYFLREKFDELNLSEYKEFIHFGLTSQDINNTAIPLSIKDAITKVISPKLVELSDKLTSLTSEWKNIPMLAHTHGQPASPTSIGKEIYVFAERMSNQFTLLNTLPHSAKFGGATGNFNAHFAAYPDIDWFSFANNFVNDILKLKRSKNTTQIEHYDNIAALCDNFKRINNIIIDLDRDFWTYISMEYFKQKIVASEVGSSAMPHKVNPIDFENSEGNLGIANALFEHLSTKLPISRMQRDLTDSTVLRNIGVPFAHSLISYNSTLKGLSKIIINENKIKSDLNNNVAVITEAIQTILRKTGYPDAYGALKTLSRKNTIITKNDIEEFISNLKVSDEIKQTLMQINPENYTGKYEF